MNYKDELEGSKTHLDTVDKDYKAFVYIFNKYDIIPNPNKEHVQGILAGIAKKGGYCPCRINRDRSSKCPCDEMIEEKICRCMLWIKKEKS